MKLPRGHSIVTAYAERASGPGWANTPIWVITRDGNQQLHQECIQPSDQTPEMLTLYGVSEAAHLAMVRATKPLLPTTKRGTR